MALLKISLFLAPLLVLTNCHVMYNMSLVPDECLQHKAIAADYTPLGKMVNIGNISAYEYEAPDNLNNKRMLIGVYDIYGLSYPNLKQVADQLAIQSGGFRVILPDFYRGDDWRDDRNPAERPEWLQRVGDWNSTVKIDLINIVRYYESEGVQEFAIYGMCWGGKVATLAAKELSDVFKASGLIHPSSVENSEAIDVQIPMYLMPSNNEVDMIPFYEVLQNKFGNNSGHRRFDDMSHGFSGARGNFSDPLIQERVNEVITTLGAFFDRNLNETKDNGNGSSSSNIQFGFLFVMTFITSFVVMLRS